MTEYRPLPEHYANFKRPIIKVIALFLCIMAILMLFSLFTEDRGVDYFKKDVYFIIILFSLSFFITYYQISKHQKKTYDSYRLIIGDDYITRLQSNMHDVTISFKNVVAIFEYKGGLIVKSDERGKAIVVWPYINDYEEVKTLLASLKPISPFDYKSVFLKYPFLLSVVMVIGIAFSYVSNNKIIVSIGGCVALGIMGWLYYKTRSLKDTGLKKGVWLYYILAFILIMNLLAKLSA